MLLKRLYHDELAQASYMLGCQATGEAMVIDPNRDVEQYIRAAEREGLRVTAVTETHIHADFVSGSRELARRTGARLYLSDESPAEWKYAFARRDEAVLLRGGDVIPVGNVRVEVIHTPGHTPEHISFLVTDAANADRPIGVFTGDFVFVGDVGRPDLLEMAAGVAGTMEGAARQLFGSLQRFRELPDYVQVWPGHGAGSACGRSLGAVPQSTVGYEKLFNWAFQVQNEDEFVTEVLRGQPEPPRYFAQMKRINKEGPPARPRNHVPTRTAADIGPRLAGGLPVLDVRSAGEYARAHVPGTLNIPWGDSFLTWAGWLLPYDKPLALIVEKEHLAEVRDELALIGLDNVALYWTPQSLEAGSCFRCTPTAVQRKSAAELHERISRNGVALLDVRTEEEYSEGHLPGSRNIPLAHLTERLDEVPEREPVVIYCAGGTRSPIAASIVHGQGEREVVDMLDGFDAWKAHGFPVE